MGSGITQVCAQAGIGVFIYDVSQDALERTMENIEWSVGKFVENGKVDEDNETILNRITIAKDVDKAAGRKMGIFETGKGWYEYNADGSKKS